ncbi:MAG: hypothetical protein PWP34_2665 [Desulfuromonadales bacterium]|jgi:hypothetical protein|nr:hypothetical protein [Desulfuromonadales bacterium]
MAIGKRGLQRSRRRIQVRYGEKTPVRTAFTEDVHREGLFLKTAQPLRPGTRLCLELLLPDHGTVTAQGQVRWARKVPANLIRVAKKGGMGIRILKIDAGAETFERYCTQLGT